MTLPQLMTLIDRHRIATGSSSSEEPSASAPAAAGAEGWLSLAALPHD
ncbi:hypothetical protein [Streptomyces sp. RKAG337]|nr:hypothetical protein [Streptomyces sp. RKAG337]MCM2427388.1 hypothetical protein [Streptomyces sp. RKAG337]